MDFYDVIEQRFSVRKYESREIEEDKLQRVLQAGRRAPTARNRQEWKLIVVRNESLRQAVAKGADQPFLAEAPVILAAVGLTPDDRMHCRIPTDPVDCAIVLDHISLAAAAEGLGTCWIGHFDQDVCREVLNVPPTAQIIELMPLGYPAVPHRMKERKPLEDLICRDRFCSGE